MSEDGSKSTHPPSSDEDGLPTGTLYLVSGKIAAGKSTLARQLAQDHQAVLLSEDSWLSALYPDEVRSLEDYVRCAGQLQSALGPHVIELLRKRQSVVMDFPANTLKQRQWLRKLFEACGASHELHVLDVPDSVCKARLVERNKKGDHPFQTSEADFEVITRFYVLPTEDEGFTLIYHPH